MHAGFCQISSQVPGLFAIVGGVAGNGHQRFAARADAVGKDRQVGTVSYNDHVQWPALHFRLTDLPLIQQVFAAFTGSQNIALCGQAKLF
ncbi:hypothetical protein [Aliamphritea spongicola]|nr:hypothetical protein [Aliamphritea spongicola]